MLALLVTTAPARATEALEGSDQDVLRCLVATVDPAGELAGLAAAATGGPEIDRRRRGLEDCVAVDAVLTETIRRVPRLRRLQARIDGALTRLKAEAQPPARTALDEDSARLRARLRHEVTPDRVRWTLDDVETGRLAALLEARLRWLERIDLQRQGVLGTWENVSGEVIVTDQGSGRVLVEAAIGDLFQSGWTCEARIEVSSEADADRERAPRSLSLTVDHGLLLVFHDPDPLVCGGGSSLSGVYFARDPLASSGWPRHQPAAPPSARPSRRR